MVNIDPRYGEDAKSVWKERLELRYYKETFWMCNLRKMEKFRLAQVSGWADQFKIMEPLPKQVIQQFREKVSSVQVFEFEMPMALTIRIKITHTTFITGCKSLGKGRLQVAVEEALVKTDHQWEWTEGERGPRMEH